MILTKVCILLAIGWIWPEAFSERMAGDRLIRLASPFYFFSGQIASLILPWPIVAGFAGYGLAHLPALLPESYDYFRIFLQREHLVYFVAYILALPMLISYLLLNFRLTSDRLSLSLHWNFGAGRTIFQR